MSRSVCQNCQYSVKTCICAAIKLISNDTKVIILQHPSELKASKNTARLAQLSLTHCVVINGESDDDFKVLNNLPVSTTAVLYPSPHAKPLDNTYSRYKSKKPITHLIVIDGTWKKAYKILQLTKNLNLYQHVSFSEIPTNRYTIRKAPRGDSLSTLEAIAHSLYLIEDLNPSPLYELLDFFIQKQTQFMPHHIKARYND